MSEDPPKPGSLVFAVGEVATGAGGAGSSMVDHTGESGAGHDINTGKELRLASVAGAPDMVYSWPLTVGKGGTFYNLNTMLQTSCSIAGSVKKGEDEHDQAVEILDTIRWVCEEQPELREMMGDLLHSYNKTSWDSMNK